jgi:ATP-binding cassette subfamily B protein
MGYHHHHVHGDEDEKYKRTVPDRVLFSRMVKYITRHKRRLVLLILVTIISTGINLLPPYMFTLAIDKYIADLDTGGLALISIAFVIVYLLIFATQVIQRFIINWLGAKLGYDMRLDIFSHLQKLGLDFYAKRKMGSLVSRVTNDVDRITELVTSGVASVIADFVTLGGIIIIMITMDVRLSVITFTILPLMIGFLLTWGRKVRVVYRATRRTIASVSAKLEESVSGMKEIQCFGREGETRREFQKLNTDNMKANVLAGQVMSAFWPVVAIFTAIGNCLVLWFGGSAVINGALSVGVLFGFMSYLNRFFWPIEDLSNFWNSVQSALAAAERVFGIMDSEIMVANAPDAVEANTIERKIVYEKLSFSYEEGQPVLRDIDLEIEPNTTVALVGPTGVGKTTLINLLYRFYDPTQGRVTVGGQDIRGVTIESLRDQMAIVLQDTYLFSGSIMANIKYGRLEATDEEVIEVTKAVGAHEFIKRLPEGYETEVRERGGRLSQGQRQLVSLARALLANPVILIMDEATSSIDAYTELIIQSAMHIVLKNRTSIIIAHRLSTVRKADKIVVIQEGRIAETGSHQELIRRGGLYKRLYEMQFKDEIPNGTMETVEP